MKRTTHLLALLVFAAAVALADDAPQTRVRVRIDAAGPIAVGQTVRLVVDALVTTWLTSGLELPALDVPGAVVAPSDEQPAHLTEAVEGTRWFGVSRVYLVTPTQPGDLVVPPITLALSAGQAPGPVEVRTSPLTLSVVAPPRPPGAERAVAATTLVLTQHLDRALAGLRVGDSIARTIAVSADGVRGMFLPPAVFPPIAGLAVYPAEPDVDDVTAERGAFTGGRRIDTATYVVERPGRYTLPGVSVQWWNIGTQTVQTATVPAITFDAVANPAAAPVLALPADEDATARARFARPLFVSVAVLAFAAAAYLLGPWIAAGRRRRAATRAERRQRYQASEDWAFAQVTDSLRGNDPATVYPALLRWLARATPAGTPATVDTLGIRTADPVLGRQLATLTAALYADAARAPHWTAGDLAHRLTEARGRLRAHADADAARAALPPLNPD